MVTSSFHSKQNNNDQAILRLKSSVEPKFNQYGVERCAVSRCKKTKRCVYINGHRICSFHAHEIRSDESRLGPPADPEFCHAIDCWEHQRLLKAFRGKFCQKHFDELSLIRSQLALAKSQGRIYAEIFWRQQELGFRKFPEPVHVIWLNRLEQFYGTASGYQHLAYPEDYPEDPEVEYLDYPEDYLEYLDEDYPEYPDYPDYSEMEYPEYPDYSESTNEYLEVVFLT